MHPRKQIVLQSLAQRRLPRRAVCAATKIRRAANGGGVVTHKQVAVNFEITWQPGPAVGNEPLLI